MDYCQETSLDEIVELPDHKGFVSSYSSLETSKMFKSWKCEERCREIERAQDARFSPNSGRRRRAIKRLKTKHPRRRSSALGKRSSKTKVFYFLCNRGDLRIIFAEIQGNWQTTYPNLRGFEKFWTECAKMCQSFNGLAIVTLTTKEHVSFCCFISYIWKIIARLLRRFIAAGTERFEGQVERCTGKRLAACETWTKYGWVRMHFTIIWYRDGVSSRRARRYGCWSGRSRNSAAKNHRCGWSACWEFSTIPLLQAAAWTVNTCTVGRIFSRLLLTLNTRWAPRKNWKSVSAGWPRISTKPNGGRPKRDLCDMYH